MPIYEYECPRCGRIQDAYNRVEDRKQGPQCCGVTTHQVITRAPMGFVAMDICYDSPIDGRPITSKAARIEDLKRNGCRPYEAGEKEDWIRRRQHEERAMDKRVEESVERWFETAPTEKRERLANEVAAGADVAYERKTV